MYACHKKVERLFNKMAKLILKKSTSKSDALDEESVHLLRNLFFGKGVKERLEIGGTLPMIDGYLELLNSDGIMEAKLTVQVKHLTHSPVDSVAYYDIPNSIFAYAHLNKGEVVIFIACDPNNETFYWRYIDIKSIQEFIDLPQVDQQTKRYYFTQSQVCNKTNLFDTLSSWRRIFDQKMAYVKDEKALADHFVEMQRSPFTKINTLFSNLKDSHLIRHEVDDILSWVKTPIDDKQGNLCILQGNAGVGKSVVIKDLIEILDRQNVKMVCIKADSLNMLSEDISLDKLIDHIQYYKASQHSLVVIVDQIDALSQYLTNDRERINIFVTLLSKLKECSDVKMIVSCRKYDLEYDQDLKSLCNNAKVIELGDLSKEDVKRTLDLLCEDLYTQLDSKTIKLLQTAHLLNLFCIVYNRNSSIINYKNAHHFYDEFWKTLMCNIPANIKQENVEKALYQIVGAILNQNTLSPIVSIDSTSENIFEYLASNNAINREGQCYSFFHQSFYDYALARRSIDKKQNYFEWIEKKFQGLEIRSSIKAVLEYEKEHNLNQYSYDLKFIFNSTKIRQHVKLLTLSLIVFSENIHECEKEVVKDVCQQDSKFLSFFLRGIHNDKWFILLKSIVSSWTETLSEGSELLYPIANYLSTASYKYSKDVFDYVMTLKDESVKSILIKYILRGHNDYRRKFVQDALLKANLDSHFFVYALLDALTTNEKFVLKESEKLIRSYLCKEKRHENKHDAYMLVEKLCKKLVEEYPNEYVVIFHRCFIEAVKKKGIYTTGDLLDHSVDNYDYELLNSYKSLLARMSCEGDKVKSLVTDLITTNNECAVCMAFEIMAITPSSYNKEIFAILNVPSQIYFYLQGDMGYYFLILLSKWYAVQDVKSRCFYKDMVLNYKSPRDFFPDKQRNFGGALYPYLWYDKWKLVSVTLPEVDDNISLKRCRQEIYRRYNNRSYKLRKPNHLTCMAEVCGGTLNEEKYATLSLKNWLHIFAVNEWGHHNRKPVDLRVNADQFRKCISESPDKFMSFVMKLFSNNSILPMYKIAGIKGLLKGGIDICLLWPCVKKFLALDFVKNNPHDFYEILKYYFESENIFINELIPFLRSVIAITDGENQAYPSVPSSDELGENVNSLLTKALNSPQGKSVDLLIKLCGIDERKISAYQLLNEIEPSLTEDLKILVIHKIFDTKYYDDEMTQVTFNQYIERMPAEALYVCSRTIQYYWYHKPMIIQKYIDRIEADIRAHKILAEIYFYGLTVPERCDDCERRLERLLTLNNEEVIADIVKVCLKSYSHDEYMEISDHYLRRYANDGRENVIHAYCWYAKELPVSAIDIFMDVYSCFKANKYRDVSDELKYIKKCVVDYPKECLLFILAQEFEDEDNSHMVNEAIIEALLMIYKRLNEEKDIDSLNLLMDRFEGLFYSGHNSILNEL